jgi:hypothetical protein
MRLSLERDLERVNRDLEEFQGKLKDNPYYALEWSMEAFTSAAKQAFTKRLLAAMSRMEEMFCNDEERILAHLRHTIEIEVRNGARWPARSTSVPSNLLNQCELAVAADFLTTWFDEEAPE